MNATGEDVEDLAERVTDRDSFLTFLRALIADRQNSLAQEAAHSSSPYGPNAYGWENISIESFLGAALAWAEDSRMGQTQGSDGEPAWRIFAEFLIAGKLYE